MKKRILYFFLLVLVLNFTPLPILIGLESVIHVYKYEGVTGTEITEIPEKGLKIDFKSHPELKRKFKIQLWKIWKWREYLTHERWRLEFEG